MLKKILAFLSFVLAVIVALDSYVLLKKIYAASFELYVNSVYNFVIVAVPALIAAAIILLFIYLGIMLLGKKSNKRQFIETVILTVLLITAGIVYLKKICLPAMTDSIKAKTGMTLLMASSIQGDDKIKFTKNILKYFGKADINAKDTPPGLPAGDFGGGNTALHYAAGDLFLPGAKIKNIETVKLLIANGADVNSRNNAGETPLMNASPEAAEVLIKAGADINAKNNAGLTVLMYAAIHGDYRIELTKRILEQGKNADINATAKGGVSALHVAAISNTDEKKIETVKLLIANGADVNARTVHGETPLFLAAAGEGSEEIIKALIDAGADINARNKNGFTSLMNAARVNGDINVIKFLIENGANVKAKDNDGKTAYDWLLENYNYKNKLSDKDKETAKKLLTVKP